MSKLFPLTRLARFLCFRHAEKSTSPASPSVPFETEPRSDEEISPRQSGAGQVERPQIPQDLPVQLRTCEGGGEGEGEGEDDAGDVFDKLTGATQIMLKTLQSVAAFAPVPFLGEAAALAIGILENVQKAKGNKDDGLALAEECVVLVYTINSTCAQLLARDGVDELPEDLMNHLGHLESNYDSSGPSFTFTSTLRDIRLFATKLASQSFFKRLLIQRYNSGAIDKYRAQIKRALDIFALQSQITLRQICDRILAQVEESRKLEAENLDRASLDPDRVIPAGLVATSSNPHIIPSTSPVFTSSILNDASSFYLHGFNVNNVAGDQRNVHDSDHSMVTNSGNVWNTTSSQDSERPQSAFSENLYRRWRKGPRGLG
ncbi:hypothetical protein D9758_014129 [Tetrapyrgos nigripes]|uniref:Uncharacterized protein n=1 Tax=Tetrapyrgos nigripes TaxID=182062 RepID=A0A8H5CMJ8_9AGAR|nr:hypothetical protein D9758_014129 [Tetrapyrgos nigripes]